MVAEELILELLGGEITCWAQKCVTLTPPQPQQCTTTSALPSNIAGSLNSANVSVTATY